MAAVPTGTPVVVTWAAGANPAGQSITIPSDATAVYMFWAYYNSAAGHGLASVTLNGVSPSQTYERATQATDNNATGVAVWYNPATGSRTLDPAWDIAPAEGATCIVVFVKDGDTTAWRDADAHAMHLTNAVSVTLTTVAGDLVIKFDAKFTSAPSLSAGWTNGNTTTNNSEGARLSYISASGSTTVCDSEGEDYSSVVAISIPAASSTQSYSYSATGGLTLSGASPALRARTKAAAGGVQLGGAASEVRKATISTTGGIQLGGTASFAKGQTVAAAGGLQLAGSATEIRVSARLSSGGLNLGGSADYSTSGSQTYSYTATGGMVLGGTASIAAARAVLATGGLNLGGAASLSFHESTRTIAASGGLQLGGAATYGTFNAGQVGGDWLIRKRRRLPQ